MVKFKVVRLCKQEAMSIAPIEVVRYDLDKAADLLSIQGYAVNKQEVMIVAAKDGAEATLYKNGRMLISHADTKEKAGEIATKIYETVEGSRESAPLKRL